MDLITSLTSQVMNKAMDGLSLRHKAIASNLANVDTPNYRRRDVSFEASLEKAIVEAQSQDNGQKNPMRPASNDEELGLRATRPEHFATEFSGSISDVRPEITEGAETQFRNDGNGVDVESEMVSLAKNTQRYLALTNLQGRFSKTLRSVITNGGA